MNTPILARLAFRTRLLLLAVAAAVAALVVAACSSGSSSSSGAQPSTSQNGSAGGATVSMRTVSGAGTVLVDAQGRTLYSSDQEAGGKVLCSTGDCTAIWTPLTIPTGQTPKAPAQLAGMLSTVQRPDGATQVALDGKPLYTFSFDHAPGDVGGDGEKDSFGGTNFTWHAAKATGGAPAPATTQTPSTQAPSGGNGYNY